MIMNHISILIRSESASLKLLIFSYVSCGLFILSSSLAVMAQTPATATVAFMSKRDGNAEIYVMNPDGSGQRNLTQHPAEDYDPAWSPDGKQIMFSSNRDAGVFDLYLMDADGTNVRKVFETLAYRMNPAWSPMANGLPMHREMRKKPFSNSVSASFPIRTSRFTFQHSPATPLKN